MPAAPQSVGYSGTPLARKLGIKPGERVVARGAPENYEELLDPIPENVVVSPRLAAANRFIHLFVRRKATLEKEFAHLASRLERDGMLWVSWPKKASGVSTEVDEAIVRATGLANGLVDVKICAVDETWSGLKFVYRVEDR